MTPRPATLALRRRIIFHVKACGGSAACHWLLRQLEAEGYTRHAAADARAGIVIALGKGAGTVWRLAPDWEAALVPPPPVKATRVRRTPEQRSAADAARYRARKAAGKPVPLQPAPVATPRACASCGAPVGRRAAGVEALCLRCERRRDEGVAA